MSLGHAEGQPARTSHPYLRGQGKPISLGVWTRAATRPGDARTRGRFGPGAVLRWHRWRRGGHHNLAPVLESYSGDGLRRHGFVARAGVEFHHRDRIIPWESSFVTRAQRENVLTAVAFGAFVVAALVFVVLFYIARHQ